MGLLRHRPGVGGGGGLLELALMEPIDEHEGDTVMLVDGEPMTM